jgi:hypothetical protein
MASRRDGRLSRRQTSVALAGRGQRGRSPRSAGAIETRQEGCSATDAKAAQEAGLRPPPPPVLATYKLRSYGAARRDLGLSALHEQGLRQNNRAENSLRGPSVRISRSDDGNERCRASSRPDRPSDFSASPPRSTTRSTCNANSFPAAHFACSGRRQRKRGRTRPSRHNGEEIDRTNHVPVPINVIAPASELARGYHHQNASDTGTWSDPVLQGHTPAARSSRRSS